MISPIADQFEQVLQRGDLDAVLDLTQARITATPLDAGAWHLYGHALDALDQPAEAEKAFLRARTLVPQLIRFRFSLAGASFMRGDWPRAARHFRACVEVQPQWKDAWTNLARAELKCGRHVEAFAAASRAVELPPDDLVASQLQAICAGLANVPAAIMLPIRERISKLTPDDPEAFFQLAMAHEAARHYPEMHTCLRRCLLLDPDYLTAHWIATQMPQQGQFQNDAERNDYLQQWRAGIAAIERQSIEAPAMYAHCEAIMQTYPNFYLAYLGGALLDEQQRYGVLMQRIATRVCDDLQIVPRRIERRRRRIGVISGMLQQHSVTKLFMPAFLALDRSQFEVIGFCPRNQRDAWSDRYERELDGFHFGVGTPRQWAQKIAEADLDVLVYLDVGMYALTSSLAALRLASVQAVLWGHPFTTGLKNMDWFISCAAMEPDNHREHYTEKTMLLPGMGCVFEPPVFSTDQGAQTHRQRPHRGVHAACLQNAEKLTPRHDALFVRLLQMVPDLHLSFTPGVLPEGLERFKARLRRACESQSVDFDARISVHGWLNHSQFAAIVAKQDFILDSLDWSGGVTALETFWLDKPILTLPGSLMRGRHTYAMLRQMQIEELVASDEDDYLLRAVRLAADADWRDDIVKRIKMHKHRLFRDATVTAALSKWLSEVQPD